MIEFGIVEFTLMVVLWPTLLLVVAMLVKEWMRPGGNVEPEGLGMMMPRDWVQKIKDLEEQLRHKYLLDGASEHVARERDREIERVVAERDELRNMGKGHMYQTAMSRATKAEGELDAAEKHVEILRARAADSDKIHNRRAVSLNILREQLHEIKGILDYTSIEKENLSAEIVKLNGALLDAKKRKRKQPMCPR